MNDRWDVIVVGAGLAGLTAARELARRGRRVLLLEGRERTGGRIHSAATEAGVAELGAEFVHGGNPAFWRLLRAARARAVAVPQRHWLQRQGRLRRADSLWPRVGKVMAAIGAGQARGRSVGELWARGRGRVPEDDRALARNFIEGFEAAPLGRMSAEAMAEIGAQERQWRLPGGYGRVIAWLESDFRRRGGELRCGHRVRRIRWRRGAVAVDGFEARALLVTVPLGLESALRFQPALAQRRRLRRLRLGQVRRVTLLLDRAFWTSRLLPPELRGRGGKKFGFVHAEQTAKPAEKSRRQSRGPAFPTWWARGPGPQLVGWVGGPRAEMLTGLSPARVRARSLAALAAVLGAPVAALKGRLRAFHSHDWSADPLAQGAYSYARAGWEKAPLALARPVGGTIFFAGEATADPAELGTAHGAHASGLRAARQILRVC